MNCKFYRGKCLFLNGTDSVCLSCPVKKAYNKGIKDEKQKLSTAQERGKRCESH